jgi:hypothetical protein
MPLKDNIQSNNYMPSYDLIEEKRVNLEKKLGAKKFIECFPSIQVKTLN